jgi:UDPglucose--hexose-1-phosphate uridylyltransferase
VSAPGGGSERRLNLLTGDWVLVSPQRLQRPWRGEVGREPPHLAPAHDPDCHLCPGAIRAGGHRMPDYDGPYVFDNDFPALTPASATTDVAPTDPLLIAEPQSGVCRVICYGPDHGRPMSRMSLSQIGAVIDTWVAESRELDARPDIAAVTIFENRGEMMGASSPHPHGQVWAASSIPNELAREEARQKAWFESHGETLLTAYLRRELEAETRIVIAGPRFVALVPFWASWPFETLLLPRRPVAALADLDLQDRQDLARVLKGLARAYDALFGVPFPYSMGFHQRPSKLDDAAHVTLHAHVYPPLLRSATVRKHMVGFELLAMPQRDLTPEAAAARLRAAGQESGVAPGEAG